MIDVKAATVTVLSVSTLTTYLQQNLNAELALLIVGMSTLLGMCLTVIYHHDKVSTLLASVGLAAGLCGFLPIYTFLSLHISDTVAFCISIFLSSIMPSVAVYLLKSKVWLEITTLLEQIIFAKLKKILNKLL